MLKQPLKVTEKIRIRAPILYDGANLVLPLIASQPLRR